MIESMKKEIDIFFGLDGRDEMQKDPPKCHYALVVCHEGISALCFNKPHAINTKLGSWTTSVQAVTCRRCLSMLRKWKKGDRAISSNPCTDDEKTASTRSQPSDVRPLAAGQAEFPIGQPARKPGRSTDDHL